MAAHGSRAADAGDRFLLEIEGLSEVSDDMQELVEDEWPELVHKLPPKVPTRR